MSLTLGYDSGLTNALGASLGLICRRWSRWLTKEGAICGQARNDECQIK